MTNSTTSTVDFDRTKFRLIELTSQKDIQYCHTHNFVQWNGGFTLDEYLAREKTCFEIQQRNGCELTYWALQELDNDGDWKIVSACESVCRPALYKVKSKPVNETISHSIGSVFTPKSLRGKGYAKTMMTLLAERLHSYKTENLSDEQRDNSVIALWSDVGLFYGLFGYELTNIEEIKVSIKYDDNDDAKTTDSWPNDVEPLSSFDEIKELIAQDEATMVEIIDQDTENDGITRAIIAPRPGIFENTFWRAKYAGSHLSKTTPKGHGPDVFGAKCNGSWMLWTQDYNADKLYAIRIYSDKSKYETNEAIVADIAKLYQAAIAEAKKWKLPYFCSWVPDLPRGVTADEVIGEYKKIDKSPEKIQLWQREGSLSMYHTSGVRKDLKWVFDGKYAWF